MSQYQNKKDVEKDLLELFIALIWFLLVTSILPQIALFFGGGIEDSLNLQKFTFYNSALAIVFIMITVIKFINVLSYVLKWNFEIPFFLHDPEFSPIRNIKQFNDVAVIVLAFLLISLFGILSSITQTAIVPLQEQVTETAQITFAIYPASPSETMTMIAFLCTLILIPNYFAWRKWKYPFAVFCIINLVGFAIGGGIYGYWLHTFRYGADPTAIGSVVSFWATSGFITALTGSCIPALIQHDVNNGILSAKELFSSSSVTTFVTILMIIVFVLLALRILYLTNQKKPLEKTYKEE